MNLPDKRELHYVGRYKGPLLYQSIWFPQSGGIRGLPPLHGEMVLDGHPFFLDAEWEGAKQRTLEALEGKDDAFFIALFAVCSEKATEILAASKRLDGTAASFKNFFISMQRFEYPGWLTLPAGEAFDEHLERLKVEEPWLFFRPKKPTPLMLYQKELGEKSAPELLKKYRWVGMMHFWGSPLTEGAIQEQKLNNEGKPWKKAGQAKPPKKHSWLLNVSSELSFWRQNWADTCAMASLALRDCIEKLGLDFEEMIWLAPEEFFIALETRELPPKNVLAERKRAFGIIYGKKNEIVTGDRLKQLTKKYVGGVERASVIKGTIASPGIATGRAKIVLSPDENEKVKKGDILVVAETTPDFIPAISRCAAIVADNGGLTSHAAIISRELGIPCIVGAKIATRVYGDGELLEVDAYTGIVSRL